LRCLEEARYRYPAKNLARLVLACCRIWSAISSRAYGVGAARRRWAFSQASSRQAKMFRSAVGGTVSENRPGHSTCWISGYTTGRARTSVAEACRTFGISRTTYDRWAGRAQRSGLTGLLPKGPAAAGAADRHPTRPGRSGARRSGRPTLGARQLVGHLADRGVRLSPSRVQKLLGRHRPGSRAQRVAALAQLTAATTGIVTTPAKDSPFGFCPFAARPGDLVAGDKSARDAASLVDHLAERLAGIGTELTGVLTDNGPEFTGHGFTSHLKDLAINHQRIPPRSPNHNAVCERFQGTALQEFSRPAFHRQRFARLADLGAQFQGWRQHYNTRRRNHGDFMRGRTPFAVMEAHLS
jgi:hypothetical protein